MAVPPHKTLHNLAGNWTLNKPLSDPYAPVLALEGVNALIRKAASKCSVHLTVTQPTPDEIHVQQKATGASIPGTAEDYILDWQWRESKDPLFGQMKGRARWVKKEEAPEGDWEDCDEGMLIQVEGQKPSGVWGGTHYWGFEPVEGQRKHTRRIYLFNDEKDEKMSVRMVYDFDRE